MCIWNELYFIVHIYSSECIYRWLIQKIVWKISLVNGPENDDSFAARKKNIKNASKIVSLYLSQIWFGPEACVLFLLSLDMLSLPALLKTSILNGNGGSNGQVIEGEAVIELPETDGNNEILFAMESLVNCVQRSRKCVCAFQTSPTSIRNNSKNCRSFESFERDRHLWIINDWYEFDCSIRMHKAHNLVQWKQLEWV